MENSQKIIVRFPPSPTGLLHMGNVRTALYNYLFTKKHGGDFLIRVEDTDKLRSKKEYEENMFEEMKWLNLEHSNPGKEWRQSERAHIYQKYLDQLIKSGVAYISEESEGENREVVRFKNPGGKIKFDDLIRGQIEIEVDSLGDFIIARNINEPLYHLAVVIDDLESGVTHIIRGEDHISNTPRQILIWKAIAEVSKIPLNIPQYAHLPMILAPDKSKLSKRKHGEMVSLKYYREKGYEPEAIINFIALIGWNPGTDQEIFGLEELVRVFDLTKVQKKGAIFNTEKLDWLNREYLLREKTKTQIAKLKEQIGKTKFGTHPKIVDDVFVEKFLKIVLDRIHRWGEISELLEDGEFDYFFANPTLEKNKLIWKTDDSEATKQHLEKVLTLISKDTEKTAKDIMSYADEAGRGSVLWPLRYALSGKDKSPDPITLLDILGPEASKRRIEMAIQLLANHS